MGAVVVRARFDSETMETGVPWQFKKGDLGVLTWKRHGSHPRFLEPRVIWDDDPKEKSRRVILASIAIVGIETLTARILLFSRSVHTRKKRTR
jgi:hypothetical protein